MFFFPISFNDDEDEILEESYLVFVLSNWHPPNPLEPLLAKMTKLEIFMRKEKPLSLSLSSERH